MAPRDSDPLIGLAIALAASGIGWSLLIAAALALWGGP
jgi:hypothetical protein